MKTVTRERKWCKKRHIVMSSIMRAFFKPYLKYHYGFSYEKLEMDEPFLCLYNHQTIFDQFAFGLMIRKKSYFVVSDDVMTNGFISSIINYFVHPIAYKKASTDFGFFKSCKKVISEGGSIVISPEGNRTFSGRTEYIKPSIVKLIRFLKIPVVVLKLEGGYGVMPRFSEKRRVGKCHGSIEKVYRFEEYSQMTDDELYSLLLKDLYVNESLPTGPFKSKRKAEYLERVIYHCPHCGVTHFVSKGDELRCTTCDLKVKYNEYKQFESVSGTVPFNNVLQWYEFQQRELLNTNLLELDDQLITEDVVSVYEYIPRKKRILIGRNLKLKMYKDRIVFDCKSITYTFLFDDIVSSGVFGKNKVSFFLRDKAYQIKGSKRFNAIKYVQYMYKYKIDKGGEDNAFLGL